MLSLIVLLNELKRFIPLVVIVGPTPVYFLSAVAWRLIGTVLPRKYYDAVDTKMYSISQRIVLLFFENISGAKVIIYGDWRRIPFQESAIFICNHQSTTDWVVADMLALRKESLGNVRYVLKHSLQYLPLYGFYFYLHNCIYVRRSGGTFQSEIVENQLSKVKESEENTWLVIFPEGTRLNPDKSSIIQKSQAYAEEKGFPKLERVLSPRVRGLQMALQSLRSKCDAIYDVTIAYSEAALGEKRAIETGQTAPGAPGMLDFVCCRPGAEIHLCVKRYPMYDIPDNELALERWLFARFAEKDRSLQNFSSGKGLDRDVANTNSIMPLSKTLPSFLLEIGLLAALLSTRTGRKIYGLTWILGTVGGIAIMKWKKAA